jgi:hypothetical protein
MEQLLQRRLPKRRGPWESDDNEVRVHSAPRPLVRKRFSVKHRIHRYPNENTAEGDGSRRSGRRTRENESAILSIVRVARTICSDSVIIYCPYIQLQQATVSPTLMGPPAT